MGSNPTPSANMSEYYLLNTNVRFNPDCGKEMICQEKAAAYLNRKNRIERLNIDDVVFLYQSKVGIIAYGTISSELESQPYGEGKEYSKEGECHKKLSEFDTLETPISAAEIRRITGKKYPFMATMIRLNPEGGELLLEECKRR